MKVIRYINGKREDCESTVTIRNGSLYDIYRKIIRDIRQRVTTSAKDDT